MHDILLYTLDELFDYILIKLLKYI